MNTEKLPSGVGRNVLVGTDTKTSLSLIAASISLLAVYVALEFAYRTSSLPSTGEYAHVVLPVLGMVVGAIGLYGTVRYELNYVAKGVGFGISAFGLVASPLYLLSFTGHLGDDGVIAGVLVSLFAIATFHSYFNSGLLTCWVIVGIPALGFLAGFFYVHGGSFARDYTVLEAVARSVVFTVPVGIAVGTAGFVSGIAIWRIRPVSTLD